MTPPSFPGWPPGYPQQYVPTFVQNWPVLNHTFKEGYLGLRISPNGKGAIVLCKTNKEIPITAQDLYGLGLNVAYLIAHNHAVDCCRSAEEITKTVLLSTGVVFTIDTYYRISHDNGRMLDLRPNQLEFANCCKGYLEHLGIDLYVPWSEWIKKVGFHQYRSVWQAIPWERNHNIA